MSRTTSPTTPVVTPLSPPPRDAHARSQYATERDGVVRGVHSVSPPAVIPLPDYRRTLEPRPGFRLFTFRSSSTRDAGGGSRPEKSGENMEVTRRVVERPPDAQLTWEHKLRYANLLVQPTRPIESKHYRAVVLFFASFLLPQLALFALAAFLGCQVKESMAPVVSVCACAIATTWFMLYIGGYGPLDCGMVDREDESEPSAGRGRNRNNSKQHAYLHARFPLAIGCALTLVTLSSLIFSLLFARHASTLCDLRDTISVNEAASYAADLQDTVSTGDGSTISFNDGSPGTMSATSTRSFFSFRDGFVETDLVKGVNVSVGEGDVWNVYDPTLHVLDTAAGPTSMLLLAPIWASFGDPFFLRRVPMWAIGSFDWTVSGLERQRQIDQLRQDWAATYRFGYTLSPLDFEYPAAQSLIYSSLLASAGSMLQFSGAPILRWVNSQEMEHDAWIGVTWTLVVGGALFLLIWIPTCIVHLQWYARMLAQEAVFSAAIAKRGASRVLSVRSREPPSMGEDESKDHIELASLASPSHADAASVARDGGGSVLSPSQQIHPNISRSASISSGTGLLSSQRPGSASAISGTGTGGGGAGPPRRHSWKARLWPFGPSANSISPDPASAAVTPRDGAFSAPPVILHTNGDGNAVAIPPLTGMPNSGAFGVEAVLTPGGSNRSLLTSPLQPLGFSRPLSASARAAAQARAGRSPHDPSPRNSMSAATTENTDHANTQWNDDRPAPSGPGLGLHGQEFPSDDDDETDASGHSSVGSDGPPPAVASGLGLTNRSPRMKHLHNGPKAAEAEVDSNDTPPPIQPFPSHLAVAVPIHARGIDEFSAPESSVSSAVPLPSIRGPIHAQQWQPEESEESEEEDHQDDH